MGSLSKLKIILPVLLVLSSIAFGHGDEDHSEDIKNEGDTEMAASKTSKEDLELNALEYEKSVKPVFQKKCYDCHGSGNEKPWYYVVPGAKQLMNSDMAEAKEHMDMTKGFPFAGHGTPKEDLEALKETVKLSSMPPWQYKLMHWDSGLTSEEKKIVNQWINESLNKLSNGGNK